MKATRVRGLGNGTRRPVVAHEIPLGTRAGAHETVMAARHRGQIVLAP